MVPVCFGLFVLGKRTWCRSIHEVWMDGWMATVRNGYSLGVVNVVFFVIVYGMYVYGIV